MPNVYDPQLLNRYAFERNNPYKYTDETGHSIEPYTGPIKGVISFIKGVSLYVAYSSLVSKAKDSELKSYYRAQRDKVVSGYFHKSIAYTVTGTPGQGKIDIVPGGLISTEALQYYEEPPTWQDYENDKKLLEKEKNENEDLNLEIDKSTEDGTESQTDQSKEATLTVETDGTAGYYSSGGGGGGGRMRYSEWVKTSAGKKVYERTASIIRESIRRSRARSRRARR